MISISLYAFLPSVSLPRESKGMIKPLVLWAQGVILDHCDSHRMGLQPVPHPQGPLSLSEACS